MKNIYLVTVIVVVLALVGFGLKSYSFKNTPPPPDSTAPQESESASGKNLASAYIEYSKHALETNASKRRVLYFYANWCPTCKPADQSFKTNLSKIPEDVTVIRVNYNDSDTDQAEKDLAKKYAVTYQHTYVQIDQNGNEITKWNGGKIDELLKNII